jgi:hypothetical protein
MCYRNAGLVLILVLTASACGEPTIEPIEPQGSDSAPSVPGPEFRSDMETRVGSDAGDGALPDARDASPPDATATDGKPVLLSGHLASTSGSIVSFVGRNVHPKARVDLRHPTGVSIIANLPISPIHLNGTDQLFTVTLTSCSQVQALANKGLRFWVVNPGGQFSDPLLLHNSVGLHPNDPCR